MRVRGMLAIPVSVTRRGGRHAFGLRRPRSKARYLRHGCCGARTARRVQIDQRRRVGFGRPLASHRRTQIDRSACVFNCPPYHCDLGLDYRDPEQLTQDLALGTATLHLSGGELTNDRRVA